MALPFSLLRGERTPKTSKSKRVDFHNLLPARIQEETHTFYTRSVIINYAEEAAELQDICQFRTEVDLNFETLEPPMYLDLELHYADANDRGPPEIIYDSPSEVPACVSQTG